MSSLEEIRADRPPEPGVARALLIAAVVLWLPVAGYIYPTPSNGFIVLAMFFVIYGSFGAVKGRQAGRIMTTVALAPMLLLVPYCWVGFEDDSNPYGALYALLDIAAVLLSAWAVSLLYHPNTNRYVQSVTAARAG